MWKVKNHMEDRMRGVSEFPEWERGAKTMFRLSFAAGFNSFPWLRDLWKGALEGQPQSPNRDLGHYHV
jgi:hypothetical protein